MPLGWDLLDWGLNAPQWGNHKDWEGSTLRPPRQPGGPAASNQGPAKEKAPFPI